MKQVPLPWSIIRASRTATEAVLTPLQRHPIPLQAHFRHSLVVIWAYPPEVLTAFLVPGLELDTSTDAAGTTSAFAAVALVELDQLRPGRLPFSGAGVQVMAGYRVFCRMRTDQGTMIRGVRVLGSQSSSWLSTGGANLTTRYHYRTVRAQVSADDDRLRFMITSTDGSADVDLTAALDDHRRPDDSPFDDDAAARRFAGPVPYTFAPDPEGIVVVKSTEPTWTPTPVRVDVTAATFFDHGEFAGVPRRLAAAFHAADQDYGWHAGRLHRRPASIDT